MLIEALEKYSGVSRRRLGAIAFSASSRYKTYKIKKRSGGDRVIHHPSRVLKAMQRWVNDYLLSRYPVHENALAYKKGASIRQNAIRHVGTNYTVRLDFENFFPSFKFDHVRDYLSDHEVSHALGLTDEDIEFVCAVSSREKRLTIGAPTSPWLTNIMMYDFDKELTRYCDEHALVYTRYADDIFVSSIEANSLADIPIFVEEAVIRFPYADLQINDGKTVNLSRKYHRAITGLVITPDRKVSIGRGRKREIKSLLFLMSKGEISGERKHYLSGLLSYAIDIEPKFLSSLCEKYGEEFVFSLVGRPS